MERKSTSLNEKTDLKRKGGTYELPEITKEMQCTICGEKALRMTRTVYKLPDGDDVLILLLECEKCNYKKSDIVSLYSAFKPGEYYLTVDDGDFTHKVFRGASGEIEIPEVGVSVERGPAASFEFTNIERILLKFQEQIQFFLDTTPHDAPEWVQAHESFKRLTKCINVEIPFSVVLRDFEGGSYISPTKKEKMSFKEFVKKTN